METYYCRGQIACTGFITKFTAEFSVGQCNIIKNNRSRINSTNNLQQVQLSGGIFVSQITDNVSGSRLGHGFRSECTFSDLASMSFGFLHELYDSKASEQNVLSWMGDWVERYLSQGIISIIQFPIKTVKMTHKGEEITPYNFFAIKLSTFYEK